MPAFIVPEPTVAGNIRAIDKLHVHIFDFAFHHAEHTDGGIIRCTRSFQLQIIQAVTSAVERAGEILIHRAVARRRLLRSAAALRAETNGGFLDGIRRKIDIARKHVISVRGVVHRFPDGCRVCLCKGFIGEHRVYALHAAACVEIEACVAAESEIIIEAECFGIRDLIFFGRRKRDVRNRIARKKIEIIMRAVYFDDFFACDFFDLFADFHRDFFFERARKNRLRLPARSAYIRLLFRARRLKFHRLVSIRKLLRPTSLSRSIRAFRLRQSNLR